MEEVKGEEGRISAGRTGRWELKEIQRYKGRENCKRNVEVDRWNCGKNGESLRY